MVKYCPNCGEELIDNARFCKNCGASISSDVPRQTVPQRPVQEKSYTVLIVVAYILALLIPLLGFIAGVYLLTRKDSESANKHGKYAMMLAIIIFLLSFLSMLRY